MLFCDPGTRIGLEGRSSVAFAVGGYDGSGNYGDIAQLQAAVELVDTVAEDLLVLPVIELGLLDRHRELGLGPTGGFDPARELAFGPADEGTDRVAADLGLIPLVLPETIESVVTYLYGGGYLNSRWGERKLSMAEAVDAAVRRARIDSHRIVSSGLQIAPEWARAGGTRKRHLLGRLEWIGVRDRLSMEAAASLADGAGWPRGELTGDDAIGVIPSVGVADLGAARPDVLVVNAHICDQDWVTEDAARQLEFVERLILGLGQASGLPLVIQPLLAYDDSRISEREAADRLTRRLAARPEVRAIADPIVLRPAILDRQVRTISSARITVGFSYHVALTSLMLGVPAVLMRENSYYAQKADGLRRDFTLPDQLTPTTDEDPVRLAESLAGMITDPSRAAELRGRIEVGARHGVERRARAEDRLRAELRRTLKGAAGDITRRPETDDDYLRLLHAHVRAVERGDRLSQLARWQGSRLEDVEESASWRWTASLRAISSWLRRRRRPG